MYWIGFILALLSGLFSTKLVRSFIRKYCHDINDGVFDKILIILLIIGLSITAIKYFFDQNEIRSLKRNVELSKFQDISLYIKQGDGSLFDITLLVLNE